MVNLLEDPTPIILAGIAIEAVLGIVLLRSGRGAVLVVMGVVAILVGAGVLVERLVVTQREQVEAVIEAGRLATESNDLRAALALVAPAASEAQQLARQGFAEARFGEVKVRGLTISVDRKTKPPSASARFQVIAEFESRHGNVPYRNYVGAMTVKLERSGSRWLVTDVTDVQAGVDGQPVYLRGAHRP